MRFATKEDIAAPLDSVFRAISDFAVLEAMAVTSGAEVRRTDRMASKGAGMSWDVGFRLRRRARRVSLDLIGYDPATGLRFRGQSANLDLALVLALVPLAKMRTRVNVELEVVPRTVKARLMIQSARLGKRRLDSRFHDRVKAMVAALAERGFDPGSPAPGAPV